MWKPIEQTNALKSKVVRNRPQFVLNIRHSLAVHGDRTGEVLLHLVRHGVLHEIDEAVRFGWDLGGVVAGPRVEREVGQIGLVLGL